ncbi:uncharacterized protein LOC132114902 [Carassius carassius]|uniref:uncharacterized protein LOC132114902 n=1 Tax=Carassius carassius TaxID=217509 RepID=UPI00286929A1|nr:uncharacterized protein LOC132114902 [Carassius carassius]
MIWRCVICCLFVALSLRALLSHINTGSSPDFHVICGIDGCTQKYRIYNSFYYHVKRRHSSHFISHKSRSSGSQNSAQAKGNNCRACASADIGIQVEERLFENFGIPLQPEFLPNEHVSSIPGNTNDEDNLNFTVGQEPDIADSASSVDGAAFTPLTEPEQEAMHHEESDEPEVDKLRKHASAFVLTSRVKHCLSQRAVSDIISWVQQYQASLLDCLRSQITDVIHRQSGVTDQMMSEVLDIFNNFEDPFETVSTTYMQDSNLKKQFKVVEAEEIEISQTASFRRRGTSQALTIRQICFYYIPLVRSLEQLLSHPMILAMFDNGPNQSKDGFVNDIIDGDILKSHPLFSVRPKLQSAAYPVY